MKECGLTKEDQPAFAISSSLQDDAKHYAFYGELTPDNLKQHITDYVEEKTPQTFKSQRPPEEKWEAGQIRQVVHRTWVDEIDETDLNVILLMSKNWSTNRADAEKVLTELADILKDEPSIKIAQYDFK
eukprot:UN25571